MSAPASPPWPRSGRRPETVRALPGRRRAGDRHLPPGGAGPHPVARSCGSPTGDASPRPSCSRIPPGTRRTATSSSSRTCAAAATAAARSACSRDDVDDGAATLAWAADLPGSNGKVATYGFSYQAITQFLAHGRGARKAGSKRPTPSRPPWAAWTIRDDWAYEGGAFRLAVNHRLGLPDGGRAGAARRRRAAFTALATTGRGTPGAARSPPCPTRWRATGTTRTTPTGRPTMRPIGRPSLRPPAARRSARRAGAAYRRLAGHHAGRHASRLRCLRWSGDALRSAC